MTTNYQFPMFSRLEPRTPWQGGRVTDTDVLTLSEAASMATLHAGQPVSVGDVLRAAGRGEITLRAIVHRTAKLERVGGGIYCNAGQENENTAPAGAILTLPLSACQCLSASGRASWRTFDGFETVDGILMRYTIARLADGEPDFETVPDDCRVTGNDVHALADAFKEPAPATEAVQGAPEKKPDDWVLMAQKRAVEIIERQRKMNLFPPQIAIADEISKEFRADNVVGIGGKPMSGAYIKRHALKGISSEQGKQLSTATVRGK